MIGLTRLVTGRSSPSDRMRYGRPATAHAVSNHEYRAGDSYRPVVVWNITQSCNLSCQHCYYSAVLGRNPVTIPGPEVKSIIDELAAAHVPVLLFSGGEPLIRKDIYDLVEHTATHGIKPVLSTNGTLIRKPATAARLRDCGARYIGISIDGSPATHDRFRQKKGSWDRSVEALQLCLEAGIRVSVRYTVTEHNIQDLWSALELADSLGVQRFCLYHLVPTGRGTRSGDIDNAERRNVVEALCEAAGGLKTEILTVDSPADGPLAYLWARRRAPQRAASILRSLERQGGDGTGQRIVEIDHDGELHPNQFWLDHSIGNVRRRSFRTLWNDHERQDPVLRELRRPDKPYEGKCGTCVFRDVCGGFRARALRQTGSLWGSDQSCPLTAEERRNGIAPASRSATTTVEVPE